ncbi:MAG TPA: NADP-dependent isocitrate dehydrogenase, partial [Labilithrix sp.]
DAELEAKFKPVAKALREGEKKIDAELKGAQGKPVDVGGYYHPDPAKVAKAMRPSATLNAIIEKMSEE